MARTYKRDGNGRFAGGAGGGGKISSGLAAKKKAVSDQVSRDALAGKKVSPARKNYVRAQAAAAQQAKASAAGKGSKAARRAAAPKPAKASKSLMDRVNAARAAGRAKGKAMALKAKKRNDFLDRKAKAYGG